MLRSYEKLFEDGAKLKNSSSSVVCLLYNRYKCVIMLWLFGDPHVILFLFFSGVPQIGLWIWWPKIGRLDLVAVLLFGH